MSDWSDFAEALGISSAHAEYVPVSQDRIPMEEWGKDHWSTFVYLETRIVDNRGLINHDHMRCHGDRHPFMLAAQRVGFARDHDGSQYPTQLRGGAEAESHDDYDCIDDMIAEGLVTATLPTVPDGVLLTGLVESELMVRATYVLTELGWRVVGQLRSHRGSGGSYATFRPQL